MSFSNSIAARIKELRKSKGLTQEKLSEKANMDLTAFSRIERGKNANVQVNTLDKIISALEVNYQTFFSFSDSSEPKERIYSKLSLLEDDDNILDIIEKILDLQLNQNKQ